MNRKISLVVAGLLALAVPAAAQMTPLGSELVVNSYTTGYQATPRVALGESGGLVIWASEYPGTVGVLMGQSFGGDGRPLGGEFQIDGDTAVQGVGGHDVGSHQGEFVVAWTRSDFNGASPASTAHLQRYDQSGGPLGAEHLIGEDPDHILLGLDLASDGAGPMLLLWDRLGEQAPGEPWDFDDRDLMARVLGPSGLPVGGEFAVNAPAAYMRGYGAAAASGDDHFVAVWEAELDAGNPAAWEVSAKRFAGDGSPIGGEFQVAASQYRLDGPEVAAAADGSFVVAWGELDLVIGAFDDVRARRYASDGGPVGASFLVNGYTTQSQFQPSVATDPTGGFHVIWTSAFGAPPIDEGVFGQSFDASGAPLGGEVKIGDSVVGFVGRPQLALGPRGAVMVAWNDGWSETDGPDGDERSVMARRAQLTGVCFDEDGDGFGLPGDASCAAGPEPDCDDDAAHVNPGQAEIPGNGLDDDCDPTTPSGCGSEP